jgi:hypothetical protein
VYALCDRDADKKEAKEGKLSDGGKATDAKAEAKVASQTDAVRSSLGFAALRTILTRDLPAA